MIPFPELIKPYLGQPYKREGVGDGGWGCVGLCYDILKKLGKNIITEYEGKSITNYKEWEDSVLPEEVDTLIKNAIMSVGKEISIKEVLPGDILMLEIRRHVHPAIYVGNGNAISSFKNAGVTVFKIDKLNKAIKARRL